MKSLASGRAAGKKARRRNKVNLQKIRTDRLLKPNGCKRAKSKKFAAVEACGEFCIVAANKTANGRKSKKTSINHLFYRTKRI